MRFFSFLVAMFLASNAWSSWKVQAVRKASGLEILNYRQVELPVTSSKKLMTKIPFLLHEDAPPSPEVFEEYLYSEEGFSLAGFSSEEVAGQADWPGSEVRSLVSQGPVQNRINLTIVGDGYTMAEKAKFFADAQRITDDLFQGQTFAGYLPLFNVNAVFVPSSQSGLGDGRPKDTALKLYRDPPGSKRGVMPGDVDAAERAIALAPATDYPILLANDDYYGGLGGRYAITTRSPLSGTVVLRHELGHNFGAVGEEYDGGYVYTGANHSPSSNVSWSHWVEGTLKINESLNLGGEYMWKNLSAGPIRMDFDFPAPGPKGEYLLNIYFSSVGWEGPNAVTAALDGKRLLYNGHFTDDRNFYEILPARNVVPGPHSLQFTENSKDGDNVLAFTRVYALENDYDLTPNKIDAFSSFHSEGHRIGYRPTHDSCLMRNMLLPRFCSVDLENMWQRFLDRVNLIDDVAVSDTGGEKTVKLVTPPLQGLEVRWYVSGPRDQWREIASRRDLRSWNAEKHETGLMKVRVEFKTPEVRSYTPSFVRERIFSL
jgi:hypothetical protein